MLHFVDGRRANPSGQCSICSVAQDGTLLADHLVKTVSFPTFSAWQDGSLLAVTKTGDTLYVCTAAGHLQAINLGRPAAQASQIATQVSSCNGLAAVCIMGQQAEVLFVDLAKQQVTYRHGLPGVAVMNDAPPGAGIKYLELAQSSCSLAIASGAENLRLMNMRQAQTRVLATRKEDASWVTKFVLLGGHSPSWDQLGRFLAVMTPAGMCVWSVSGISVAKFSQRPARNHYFVLCWQPEGSELLWEGRDSSNSLFKLLLSFN